MIQTPAPDIPPFVFNNGFDYKPLVIAFVIAVVVVGVVRLLQPIVRGLGRRLEGGAAPADLQDELDLLRSRVLEIEPLGQRVAELEERLDFAERMLAARQDVQRLPAASQEL